ncbi:MAG: nitroreductase family deazaflavin-dependent oxidoreductase [Chloroflexi bacterium]|nr:nitroreductase family deazaflavin-dependent oxidoreductase [Chloroflexota bacterium]
MPGDDWAARRPSWLKGAQRWFGRLIGLVAPIHARLALATNGWVSPNLGGRPGIILETIGRRSGTPRRVVLTYLPDGKRIVVTASNYGREGHPAWYHNIEAEPSVTIIYKRFRRPYRARIAAGEERLAYLRATDDATYGVYAAYARKTSREIPVVILEPTPQ